MMKQFKSAPLVETIFEIRFPAELAIEYSKDKYYEKIKEEFPQIFIPKTITSEAYALEPYQFLNTEGTQLILLAINKFAFITRIYENFQTFKQECLNCLTPFLELYNKISTLKRVGLRYVNHIPVSKEGEFIPVEKYLNFGYKLPDTISNRLSLFSSEFVTKVGNGKLRAIIQYESSPKDIIILDFDYFLEKQLSSSEISTYLEESHRHTEEIFLSLITEEYKKIMEGD